MILQLLAGDERLERDAANIVVRLMVL